MPRQKISQNEQKEMLRNELRPSGPWYYDYETNVMESGREAAKAAEQAMLPCGTDEDRPNECFLLTRLPPGKRFLVKQKAEHYTGQYSEIRKKIYGYLFVRSAANVPGPVRHKLTTCYRNNTKVSTDTNGPSSPDWLGRTLSSKL